MNRELETKLRDAKDGLVEVLAMCPDKITIQKRVIFALEAIDDTLEGGIKFRKTIDKLDEI